jgi:hypothetical protein
VVILRDMGFENFERGYLLPKGCKDLIDVTQIPPHSKKLLKPLPVYSSPIPSWRIVLYSLFFMTGVNFLAKPDEHPILGWLCVAFAGAFIAFYLLYLNWMQTDRARVWFLAHPGLVRRIRLFCFLPRLLARLRNVVLRRKP